MSRDGSARSVVRCAPPKDPGSSIWVPPFPVPTLGRVLPQQSGGAGRADFGLARPGPHLLPGSGPELAVWVPRVPFRRGEPFISGKVGREYWERKGGFIFVELPPPVP